MKIISKDSFRSGGRPINKDDDMIRCIIDTTSIEYYKLKKFIDRSNSSSTTKADNLIPITDNEIDKKLRSAIGDLQNIISTLKCCGNCLHHGVDIRGLCAINEVVTHGCYYCYRWSFDKMGMDDREKVWEPQE